MVVLTEGHEVVPFVAVRSLWSEPVEVVDLGGVGYTTGFVLTSSVRSQISASSSPPSRVVPSFRCAGPIVLAVLRATRLVANRAAGNAGPHDAHNPSAFRAAGVKSYVPFVNRTITSNATSPGFTSSGSTNCQRITP
jgi:hypothetical protein